MIYKWKYISARRGISAKVFLLHDNFVSPIPTR